MFMFDLKNYLSRPAASGSVATIAISFRPWGLSVRSLPCALRARHELGDTRATHCPRAALLSICRWFLQSCYGSTCDKSVYRDCSDTYPEITLTFAFWSERYPGLTELARGQTTIQGAASRPDYDRLQLDPFVFVCPLMS
jgi:hypothetical protein